jgi:hypothetical protein
MGGVAFGYFVSKLQNISKRFSNPDERDIESRSPEEPKNQKPRESVT